MIKAKVNVEIEGAGVEVWTWCNRGMRAAKEWCHDTIRKCAKLKLRRVDYRTQDESALVVRRPFVKMQPATRLRLLRRKLESYTKMYTTEIEGIRRTIVKLEARRRRPKKTVLSRSDSQPS